MDARAVDQLLARIYYAPNGFGSIEETLKQARQENPAVTRAQVKAFLDKQEGRQVARPRLRNSFVGIAPRAEFQMDLADFSAFFPRSVYRYGLVAVDIFSKAVAVVPIRDKTAAATAEALNKVLGRLGIPNVVMTDQGNEFMGEFNAHLKYYDIEHIVGHTYLIFVERTIRTIKEWILKRQRAFERPWTSYIDDVVIKYNHTVRPATGMTPEEAAKDANSLKVHTAIMQRAKLHRTVHTQLHVGDFVKVVQKPRGPQDLKVNFVAWSAAAHRVEAVVHEHDGQTRYRIQGKLYLRHELLKVDDIQAPVGRRRNVDVVPLESRLPKEPPPALDRQPLRRLRRIQEAPPVAPAAAEPRFKRLRRIEG